MSWRFIAENTLVDKQLRKDGAASTAPRIGLHAMSSSIYRGLKFHRTNELYLSLVRAMEYSLFASVKNVSGIYLAQAGAIVIVTIIWCGCSTVLNVNHFPPRGQQTLFDAGRLPQSRMDGDWKWMTFFSSRSKFVDALSNARVLLCNPPFEDFKTAERQKYSSGIAPQKPLELLRRILGHARRDVMLGLVLPQQFLKGVSYRGVREELARRYREIDLVALPDKVFTPRRNGNRSRFWRTVRNHPSSQSMSILPRFANGN